MPPCKGAAPGRFQPCLQMLGMLKVAKSDKKSSLQRYMIKYSCDTLYDIGPRGRIYSQVRPFYEIAVSNLDRSMHTSLWV